VPRRPLAIVLSNDEPDSSYGARRLASAFAGRFKTEIVNPLEGLPGGRGWIARRGADALVLSGSDRSTTESTPWMIEEEEVLRAAVDLRLPTLAVCFGHQLLGKALGVTVSTREKRVGLIEIASLGDAAFAGLGRTIVVPEQHSDQITDVPEGFEIVATSDYCRVQAMRHVSGAIYGVQFHPCYDDEVLSIDEAWATAGLVGPFRHDGAVILRNLVGILATAAQG
jgi:GMP synthase-like glutamine amidotransferase